MTHSPPAPLSAGFHAVSFRGQLLPTQDPREARRMQTGEGSRTRARWWMVGLRGRDPHGGMEPEIGLALPDPGRSPAGWVCLLRSFLGRGKRGCTNTFSAFRSGFPGKNLLGWGPIYDLVSVRILGCKSPGPSLAILSQKGLTGR